MKSKLIMLFAITLFFSVGQVIAEEGHEHGTLNTEKHDMMEEVNKQHHDLPNVGNKICPVSSEEIGSMGEGIEVEYEGKIYNLCCSMCIKDFKSDPEKYIKIINEELENSGENTDEHDEHMEDHEEHESK